MLKRLLLTVVMMTAPCIAQTWSTWNGKTVGSAGAVKTLDGKTIGTSAGEYAKWNNLNSPSSAPSIAYVNSNGSFGTGSVTLSVTAGNHLVYWTYANDTTTGHTCSDGGVNTYVPDIADVVSGPNIGGMGHVHILASTTTLTISCTGTSAIVTVLQYSGGTGDLDTPATGSNPSSVSSTGASPYNPPAFTTTASNTILVDGYGDSDGVVVVIAQSDGLFTTDQSDNNGVADFIGAIGHRVVTSTGSYQGGYTITGGVSAAVVVITGAYK